MAAVAELTPTASVYATPLAQSRVKETRKIQFRQASAPAGYRSQYSSPHDLTGLVEMSLFVDTGWTTTVAVSSIRESVSEVVLADTGNSGWDLSDGSRHIRQPLCGGSAEEQAARISNRPRTLRWTAVVVDLTSWAGRFDRRTSTAGSPVWRGLEPLVIRRLIPGGIDETFCRHSIWIVPLYTATFYVSTVSLIVITTDSWLRSEEVLERQTWSLVKLAIEKLLSLQTSSVFSYSCNFTLVKNI